MKCSERKISQCIFPLIIIFGRLVSHFIFKPPVKMLKLTNFQIDTSCIPKIQTMNGIINSKVKVETNNVAISKIDGYQRRYFFLNRCQKALPCSHEKNSQLVTYQRKSPFEGFFNQLVPSVITEETTKKAQISYVSFPRLVKLFTENYPD